LLNAFLRLEDAHMCKLVCCSGAGTSSFSSVASRTHGEATSIDSSCGTAIPSRVARAYTVEGNEYTTEEIDTVGHVQCTHTHNHCHTIDVAAPWSQRGAITHATEIPGRRCDRR